MKAVYSSDDLSFNKKLADFITNFESQGKMFNDGQRNVIKTISLDGTIVNVKSFKIPNLINQIAYRFFRKSKAQRSFEYAQKLTTLGIGTPSPYAYFETSGLFLFRKSFYASQHLDTDLTYRDLTTNLNVPNHEAILRAFTRFSFDLHEKGVNFLDHSPGNTLIKIEDKGYRFYLVDLNRMRFEDMSFKERMYNLSKLTIHKSMVKIMSNEYAKCSGEDETVIFRTLWKATQHFQYKYHRKKRIKKQFKFWKKSN